MRHSYMLALLAGLLLSGAGSVSCPAQGQYYYHEDGSSGLIPVPGAGTPIDYVGDDFEDPEWQFVHKLPKSARELNGRSNGPMSYSTNRHWSEGPERGQPDFLQVIGTPLGGLPDSYQALQITTMRSGDANYVTNDVQQDDLILNIASRVGSTIRAAEIPSCVVRVFLPPAEMWENRSGTHFGIRLGVRTTAEKPREGLFAFGTRMQTEPYWPGFWIHFRSETTPGIDRDSAHLKIRSDSRGVDFQSVEIPPHQFGWWTFGMSVSDDGRVHYFAKPGIDDLTMSDLLTSQFPYGYRAERVSSFFFNICNHDNGSTWSTPFAIDDPQVFVVDSERFEKLVDRKLSLEQRRAAMIERCRQRAIIR
jgi:hypothetical protein